MGKKNYNKISTEKVKAEAAAEVESIIAESTEVVENEPEIQVTCSNPIGVVVNCEKLNVRKNSSVKADILGVIAKGTEVEIFEDSSTKDFYSIATPKYNGYVMKKYISIKQ